MQRTKDISNKAIKITSKDLVGCHCHSKIKKISKKLASRPLGASRGASAPLTTEARRLKGGCYDEFQT